MLVFVFLLALPFVDLWLVLKTAERIGGGNMFAWIVVSGILGLAVLYRGPAWVLRRAAQRSSDARLTPAEAEAGVMLGLGGFLLFLPGVLTDICGLLLIIPWTRYLLRWIVVRAIPWRSQVTVRTWSASGSIPAAWRYANDDPNDVIDSHVISDDDEISGDPRKIEAKP